MEMDFKNKNWFWNKLKVVKKGDPGFQLKSGNSYINKKNLKKTINVVAISNFKFGVCD